MGQDESKAGTTTELDNDIIVRLAANTKYTPEQIRSWHSAFLRDCPNGKLTSRQFV
ncbi:unnamed protein product, partial [Rotaria magnacalcarata]